MTELDGALLEQWFAAARVGLALLDHDGRVVRENAELTRVAGRDAAELAADPEVRPLLRRAAAGKPTDAVLLRHADRPLRGVAVSVLPLEGHLALSAVSVSDDQVLQATLALALDGTDTGSFVWHVDADAIHWSPNLGPLHGLERGAAPTRYDDWLQGIHEDDRGRVHATITAALAGEDGYAVEFRVRGDRGELRWLHARGRVLRHRDGRPRSVAGLTTDVTDRKRREVAADLLGRVGLLLAGSTDDAAPLREIAELAVPVLADTCTVHLIDDEGRLSCAAAAGTRAAADERSIALLADAATATGRAQLDAAAATMVVPIVARRGTFGAVGFGQDGDGRPYDAQDLELAEEVGRRIGLALETAALHRDQREANRRLRDLQSVTDVALTHLELDALLGELLDRLADVLEADVAKVLLPDEGRRELRVRAARGLAPRMIRDLRVPFGAGAAGRIAAAGRPLILDDTGEADVVLDALREPGRSLAGVPLVLSSETIGVLVVSSRARAYRETDLRLLELVADRLARAIRQAELYEEARDAALALQRSLLPEALPTIDGVDVSARYLPGQAGTEVGGDWYDLFVLPDGRLAIVVGDVVGRGLRAATRMGRVRAGLRAYAFESDSPAEAIERMDRLVASEEPLEFTTLLAVYLDPRTGHAQACSAGHLPPVIVDADGARPVAIATGPPLGVADGRRELSELGLARDTLLLAYTDGLVEDRSRGLDAGLAELLAVAAEGGGARQLVDRVVAAMVRGLPSDDDVAVVAVGRVRAGLARTFPAEPRAVAAARNEVTRFARDQGLPDLVLRDLALAVSEACTNVVLHAYREGERGPMHVTAHRDEGGLEVTVTDEGTGVRPRADSPGVGLGLQIIERTTERFDVRDAPGGGAQLVLRFPAADDA